MKLDKPPSGYFFAPEDTGAKPAGGGLSREFGVPPFSVFDARSDLWQSRKAGWLALGIRSEVGRGENLLNFSDTILRPDPKKREQNERRITPGQGRPGDPDQLGSAYSLMGRKSTTLGKQRAIPGGGTGKNSVWKFKTDDGYKSGKGTQRDGRRAAPFHGVGTRYGLSYVPAVGPAAGSGPESGASGTSIFDPILCELFYRWFVPLGGRILDPFAGGSVRGVVASVLGYRYLGVDLRPEQVAANREQAETVCKRPVPPWIEARAGHVSKRFMPRWVVGDSAEDLGKHCKESADAVWSCPPYGDLEQYSDDPRDISSLSWEGFSEAYAAIIAQACGHLREDRFACFVVTEIRDKKTGLCRGLVPLTIKSFEAAGLNLYNDAVLLNAVGSLSIRAGRTFSASRKLGRIHQNVLVFIKGSPDKAVQAIRDAES